MPDPVKNCTLFHVFPPCVLRFPSSGQNRTVAYYSIFTPERQYFFNKILILSYRSMEVFQFFHSFSPAQTFTAFIIYKERFHQQFIKGTQLVFGCFIVPGSATGNIGNTFYIFDQIRFTADIIRQFGVSPFRYIPVCGHPLPPNPFMILSGQFSGLFVLFF